MIQPELLIETTRGSLVETRHYGHVVVSDNKGNIIYQRGDARYVTYFRSAAKPIQAMHVVLSGAYNKFMFSKAEISIMCASHFGEDIHRETVMSILHKIGLQKEHLQCGATTSLDVHYALKMALDGYAADVLFNDCSGKHAGFLAVCEVLGYGLDNYIDFNHPLQNDLLKLIAKMCGVTPESVVLGVDGCGVPVHGMPLLNMAQGYASLCNAETFDSDTRFAARTIVQAMGEHPEMLSGTNGFCTALVKATHGRLIGKIGAEAVYCVGNTATGQGLAIKLEDGNLWKLSPVVMQTLEKLKWLNADEIECLQSYRVVENRNKHNDIVGYTRAV